MNSGFSDFQDLLNITTSGQEIDAVKTELIALEEEVADNTTNIATNATAISNNSTAISNNLVLINNNTASINTNATNISTNTGQLTFQLGLISDAVTLINNNSTNITNNTVNISTNDADIASLNLNKQNTLTNGVQNLTSAEVSQLANIGTSNISDVDWRGVQYLGNVQYDVNTKFNDKLNKFGDIMSGPLNMSNNDIYNPGLIGGYSLATFASDIAAINVDIPQITTNQADILTNSSNISINAGGIAVHTIQIGQNSNDIVALDSSKLSKSGGIMTGLLEATSIDFTGSLNNISALELSRLDNITSNVQTQLNSRVTTSTGLQNLTTSEVNQLKNIGTYVISSTAWRGLTFMSNVTYDVDDRFSTKLDISGGTMSGGLNLNGYPLWNATSVTSLGDVTVGSNRYLRTDRIIPLTGTAIQLNGTTGLRANYIQSNFGTNSLNVQSNLDLDGNDLIDVGNITMRVLRRLIISVDLLAMCKLSSMPNRPPLPTAWLA